MNPNEMYYAMLELLPAWCVVDDLEDWLLDGDETTTLPECLEQWVEEEDRIVQTKANETYGILFSRQQNRFMTQRQRDRIFNQLSNMIRYSNYRTASIDDLADAFANKYFQG